MSLFLTEALSPSFKPGDAVLVADRPAAGHCRTPWYLRGKRGVVVEALGCLRDPERLAYHKPGFPGQQHYLVRFAQAQLWPAYAGPARDHLDADLAENWLEPAP